VDLSELKKSVSDMSNEELLEKFRAIRHSRANPPVRKKTKAAKSKAKPTKRTIEADINNMTPEQLDALIKQLGG